MALAFRSMAPAPVQPVSLFATRRLRFWRLNGQTNAGLHNGGHQISNHTQVLLVEVERCESCGFRVPAISPSIEQRHVARKGGTQSQRLTCHYRTVQERNSLDTADSPAVQRNSRID